MLNKINISQVRKSYVDSMVKTLTEEGAFAIERAMETKTYEHDTMNLHDSYGSAVYVDGAIRLDSIRVMRPSATKAKLWYNTYKMGQDEIIDYLMSLHPSRKGVTLVVAAAMPYASTLEEGGGNLKHKYRVLSGAQSDLEGIADKYKGKLKRIQ